MNGRHLLSCSLFVVVAAATAGMVGCAGDVASVGGDDEAVPANEADLTASAPVVARSGDLVKGSGLPLLIGLKAQPNQAARREFVFLDTSVPDGPDLEGHARFPSVTFEKRVVHLTGDGDGPSVETPTGGLTSGTSFISQALDGTGGQIGSALVDKANAEMKALWNAHPAGRFTVKMFPAANGTAHTANGFDVKVVGQQGFVTAANGTVGSYDGRTDFATLEENIQVVAGEKTTSTCEYAVTLKDAAVLENTAQVAIFHVQRTLTKKTGTNIACMKSEDKYVIGIFGI